MNDPVRDDTPSSSDAVATPSVSARPILAPVRALLTFSRVQAVVGVTAALLSIGGSVYSLMPSWARGRNTNGELSVLVQASRSGKPLPDTSVEVLTLQDTLIATLSTKDGQARQRLSEGTYRVRLSHARFSPVSRQVQVAAGQTTEVRILLSPRPAASAGGNSSLTEAGRAVSQGIEEVKRLFR